MHRGLLSARNYVFSHNYQMHVIKCYQKKQIMFNVWMTQTRFFVSCTFPEFVILKIVEKCAVLREQ